MGLTTALVVVLRYGYDAGAIALQESVIYLHATAFMLGIAWTLKNDGHVRVDILSSRLPARSRAWLDLAGHCLFLLPTAAAMGWYSIPYVLASWSVLEGSSEVSGIPGTFLLKSLIPLMAVSLLLQGLAGIARTIGRIRDSA